MCTPSKPEIPILYKLLHNGRDDNYFLLCCGFSCSRIQKKWSRLAIIIAIFDWHANRMTWSQLMAENLVTQPL